MPPSDAPPYRIITDHHDFLAIHKMPGVPFHGDEKEPGLLQLIRTHEPESVESARRLYPVHRLDQVTSGVIIFARGRKNAHQLGNEFRLKKTEKIYVALSQKVPKKKTWCYQRRYGEGSQWDLAAET